MLKEREDPTHSQLHAEILNDSLTIQIGDRCDGQLLQREANKPRVGTPARSSETSYHNCAIGFIAHSVKVDSTMGVLMVRSKYAT